MFRITKDPSSGSLIQYLAKITIVVLLRPLSPFLYGELHTRITGPPFFLSNYSTICCHNTDYVHVNGHDRTTIVILAKYCMMDPL